MKLKVKDLDIATGSALVCVLNEKDAKLLDLRALDRIKIKKGKNIETALVDIAETGKSVKQGYIGLFEEVLKSLKLKNNDVVEIIPARRPLSTQFIKKKLEGKKLTRKEINQIVWDIVHNKLSDVELTYFISACYARNMDMQETFYMTKEMESQGDILKFNKYPIIDKHCVSGVPGNRTTMIIVPIIAAAGFTMPKTSSRSITSPSGTADTMECLAKVDFNLSEIKKIIKKTNACIAWGGSLNLAPADDRIIRVERPLMIDAKSQLLASILSKKKSVSSTHLLVDIPTGTGAKITTRENALKLKKEFELLGKKLKIRVKVILTNGTQPIGNGIGPCLEARDVLWVLTNDKKAPEDLKKKSVMMAGLILEMVGIKNGKKVALEILESGKAYKKMKEIIKVQKGKIPPNLKLGRFSFDIKANKNGKLKKIDNIAISKIARVAGAPESKGAGIYLYKHVGEKVKARETIATIYSESRRKLEYAIDVHKALDGFVVG